MAKNVCAMCSTFSIWYLSTYQSIYLSIFPSFSFFSLSYFLSCFLSIYIPIYLSIFLVSLSSCLSVYLPGECGEDTPLVPVLQQLWLALSFLRLTTGRPLFFCYIAFLSENWFITLCWPQDLTSVKIKIKKTCLATKVIFTPERQSWPSIGIALVGFWRDQGIFILLRLQITWWWFVV